MDEIKKAALVLIGVDWFFNNGRMTMYLIDKYTAVLKEHYNCTKRNILIPEEPRCTLCASSERCLTDAAFGC